MRLQSQDRSGSHSKNERRGDCGALGTFHQPFVWQRPSHAWRGGRSSAHRADLYLVESGETKAAGEQVLHALR